MSYRPGDKVFAKIKGFSNWPARVNPLPPDVQIPKGKLPVFFYGTYQVSFVPVKNIVPYEKFKEKLGKPKSSPQFMTAMQEIEANPGIYMLGEDPRAERFLLQFYKFRPGSAYSTRQNHTSTKTAVRSKRAKHAPSDSPASLSPISEPETPQTKVVSPSRSRGRSKASALKRDTKPPIVCESKPEIVSETSSDISSALSKPESAEVNPTSDDDDDTETLTKHSSVDVSTQGDPLSDVDECSLETTLSHQLPTSQSEVIQDATLLDSHEARKLQRKLEKKAQKKAAKKAAKREAKRIAKEAERAERRARREARREMKRLHRLEKQQRLQEQSITGVTELFHGGTSHDWGSQMEHLDPIAQAFATGDQAINIPYEELIAAELDVLSPNLDRPTSPLRLDDYLQPEVINDSGADDSLHDATIMMKEEWAPSPVTPVAVSQPVSDNSPTVPGMKRSIEDIGIEENSPHSPDTEDTQDVPLPRKRVKADSSGTSVDNKSGQNDEPDRRHPTAKVENSPLQKKHRHSTRGKTRMSKSRKSPPVRRRRIVDSSSSEDEAHDVVPSPRVESERTDTSPRSTSQLHHKSDSHPPSPAKVSNKSELTSRKSPSSDTSRVDNTSSKKSKASELRVASEERKKHRTQEDSHPPTSPGPNDVVAQLCQHCRELKASLVRGHENFSAAVQHLTQLATIQARLPQLAEAWDLMDCIKKCRRYKLSEEVRNAAQKTFSAFQAIKSSATKEELAQTQALIAAHQNRSTNSAVNASTSSDSTPKLSKPPIDSTPAAHVDLTVNASSDAVVSSVPSPSVPDGSSTAPTASQSSPPGTSPVQKSEPGNLTADLEAKMDDMLSRIRATEERMAAAAAASSQSHPRVLGKLTPNWVPSTFSHHDLSSSTTSSGVVYAGAGHDIRAKAVAAAAAHMHDEEDEESVMSRVEQVAAYEEATKANSIASATISTNICRSPPPPPPPLPSTALRVSTSAINSTPPSTAAFTNLSSPPSVDLDLDSRIERLITGPKHSHTTTPATRSASNPRSESSSTLSYCTTTQIPGSNNGHPTIPAPLLAVADKIAAARAMNPSPKKLDAVRKPPRPSVTDSDVARLQSEHTSLDDELYDLLGV